MRLNHVVIKREMQAQRWSTVALAAETGIDRSLLNKYKNGERTPSNEHFADVVIKLGKALKINPYGLVGPDEPKVVVAHLLAEVGACHKTLDELDVPRDWFCDDKAAA